MPKTVLVICADCQTRYSVPRIPPTAHHAEWPDPPPCPTCGSEEAEEVTAFDIEGGDREDE